MTKKELYQLTKEMLFEKFSGLCAFCGDQLRERWCIWDIEPSKTVVNFKGEMILGDESYENKLPACISCNGKRVHHSASRNYHADTGRQLNIEEFRKRIAGDLWFLQQNPYYKTLLRYGLIVETNEPIIFHFEKYQ